MQHDEFVSKVYDIQEKDIVFLETNIDLVQMNMKRLDFKQKKLKQIYSMSESLFSIYQIHLKKSYCLYTSINKFRIYEKSL